MAVNQTTSNNNKRIWIGLGVAMLFCLCTAAAAIFMFYRVGIQFREGVKTDPKGAAEAAHAIADYQLPEGYQERVAMDFFVYTMVMIGPDSSESPSVSARPVIMLAQFKVASDPQQMQDQMRRSFEQQSGLRGLTMKVVEVKKMTIRGEEVDVTTFEGTDENGFVFRQLVTTFPGKDGTAMLMIMGAPQYWDQQAIDGFIESIH
jgi:hypothetical protein